jgi:O-antigen/teichoic acid export membrane protein
VSSVFGRLLNYLLVPLLTYRFAPADYGIIAELYAYMGFLTVILTFGLETGYFRFRHDTNVNPDTVYATAIQFIIVTNTLLLVIVYSAQDVIAQTLDYTQHQDYLWWAVLIVACDTSSALAFARLRAEQRAARFAIIKLIEVVINLSLNLVFLFALQTAWLRSFAIPDLGIGYVFIANLGASITKMILLAPQFRGAWQRSDLILLKRLLRYALPMVIIGLAGMVNELFDRIALKQLLPFTPEVNLEQLGIYSACYKLSILMSLFIQAFRYAGEPFFFAQAGSKQAPHLYALVMQGIVVSCSVIFLVVSLYLELFGYLIGAPYREGLHVVPILLGAQWLLGVYINLSIWYKLTDRMLLGAMIALIGSAITVIALWFFVPRYGYPAAAWSHVLCYGSLVILSYLFGRRYYPVPYHLKQFFGYPILAIALYYMHQLLPGSTLIQATALLFVFILIVIGHYSLNWTLK